MSDSKKQICRLCLQITPVYECEIIEEVKTEILKNLLIDINFDINNDAVACNRCLETLQTCFEFKSQITSFVEVNIKVDIKTILQKEMMSLENSKACRLCTSVIENEAYDYTTDWKDEVSLKDMIGHCLPEMDLNTVHEVLICKQCVSNTKKYYEFTKTCQEVEQVIKNYCLVAAGHGTVSKVILDDILKFKNDNTLNKQTAIKKECSDDKNDMDIMIYPETTSESTASIKCEEIHIKDELGISIKDKSMVKMRKCPLCPFSTKNRTSLVRHQLLHRKPEEISIYKCANCEFETKRKDNLRKHMLRHQNSQVAKIWKCEKCLFETKWQRSFKRHVRSHEYLYRCRKCAFATNFRENMLKHKNLHQDSKRQIFNCELCSYQAKTSITLKNHKAKIHMDPSVPVLKCIHCLYDTTEKALLSRHMRERHGSKFKCSSCLYVTTIKGNLRKHSLIHQEVMMKCDYCDFQTKHKGTLLIHMYRHDPSKHTLLKCDHCEYLTLKQSHLKGHQLKHMKPGETAIYRCGTCDLNTKYKNVLKSHSKICLKRKKFDKEKMSLV